MLKEGWGGKGWVGSAGRDVKRRIGSEEMGGECRGRCLKKAGEGRDGWGVQGEMLKEGWGGGLIVTIT